MFSLVLPTTAIAASATSETISRAVGLNSGTVEEVDVVLVPVEVEVELFVVVELVVVVAVEVVVVDVVELVVVDVEVVVVVVVAVYAKVAV